MISPNGIRAILFDLDGTLRHHTPTGGSFFTEYALSLGVPISEEDRIRAERWEHYYFANSPEIQIDSKKFKEEGFWTNFGRRRLIALGVPSKRAELLAPKFSEHMHTSYKPVVHVPEDARALLSRLNEEGFILGVVSNRTHPFQEELQDLDLAQYFKFSLAGGEVNSFKPNTGIFLAAVGRAGTSAAETIYVGDNYFADIVGSRRAGLRPVLYDPSRLFPEAECDIIQSFEQFPKLLD